MSVSGRNHRIAVAGAGYAAHRLARPPGRDSD
jgi:hypothetical protein